MTKKNKGGTLKERMFEWFKSVLGYAWGLRALRNIANMKHAAEHRGKAPIQNTIISQQTYSKRLLPPPRKIKA